MKTECTLPDPCEKIESTRSTVPKRKTETSDGKKCLEEWRVVSCLRSETKEHIGPSARFEESENHGTNQWKETA